MPRAASAACCASDIAHRPLPNMHNDHPLFKQYPVDSQVLIAGEHCPSPYHIYAGSMLHIGGTVTGTTARQLLANERLTPIVNQNDRVLAALWICDFTEANLGPHHELQISLFASFDPMPPVRSHPFAIYRALINDRSTRMVCHGLWNNTARVVGYNTEHLGLNARLGYSHIARGHGRWQFQVNDDSGLVATGDLALPARAAPAQMAALMQHVGIQGLLHSLRAPYVHVPVVNTRSRFADDNWVAHTYTRSASQVIWRFTAQDQLLIHYPQAAAFDFVPDFVQQNDGVRFVYLRPAPESPA